MFIIIIVGIILLVYIIYYFFKNKQTNPYNNNKIVPLVSGGLPFIGHGFEVTKDVNNFIKKCYKEYGPIFKIKIYGKEMIIICDRNLVVNFLKEKEENLSMYEVLENVCFFDVLINDYTKRDLYIKTFKNIIMEMHNKFIPSINAEAITLINDIKSKYCNNKVSLLSIMKRFIINSSLRCFTALKTTDEFINDYNKFSDIVNMLLIISYFIPRWILKITIVKYANYYKNKMIKYLSDIIEIYRKDVTKNDSIVFRKIIDDTENNFTNYQLAEFIIFLLFISAENTAQALTSLMIEVSSDKTIWDNIKKEVDIKNENAIEMIYKSNFIDACVIEAVRLNSHMFSLSRVPKNLKILGDYYIGDCDTVSLCINMLMCGECSTNLYKDTEKYDPYRYLEPRNEKKTNDSILTWGYYIHKCPGMNFALLECKIAMVYLINNFEILKINNDESNKKEYFASSAMAQRNATIIFTPLNDTL